MNAKYKISAKDVSNYTEKEIDAQIAKAMRRAARNRRRMCDLRDDIGVTRWTLGFWKAMRREKIKSKRRTNGLSS